MSLNIDVAWLCWIFPLIGAFLSLALRKTNTRIVDVVVVFFSFLAWLMALFTIPNLFNYGFVDKTMAWFSLPDGKSLGIGMLVDPLSIILVNVVSFLGLMIMIYSLKYVQNDPARSRYWFFMSLFIGSMLLLVLADNFIVFFVGWKLVGFCSYALIGYYYSDEKEHWIGGPSILSFMKPSRCGLKALLVTTFGDAALLAGVILLYVYSGTFNFMELYQTAPIWLAQMAQTPGILTLTSILLLAGPFAKSAQFPFHEWLPEAMAGPAPVSALIHAATMVKAGVYLVARLLPVLFFACWIATPGYPEALTFFLLTAAIGAFTLFLGASQALVSSELKKALAYSTMSIIGYMMLALGVAGLSPNALIDGVSSAIFQLMNHGIFKSALFLCAGIVIKASGSIYMSEMKLSGRKMRVTWLSMWIAALSLIGIPPLSGFWSKDEILLSCWYSGQYIFFAIALLSVIITTLYVIRFMGIIFHNKPNTENETKGKEANVVMLVPLGILTLLAVGIGLLGPWFKDFFHTLFENYFTESFGLIPATGFSSVITELNGFPIEILLAISSISMIIIGIVPAYRFFISHKSKTETIINGHNSLRLINRFLWNRWYIDSFYNKIFVNTALRLREPLVKYIENPIDFGLNVGIPRLFGLAYRGTKKIQTGVLSINLLYVILLIIALLLVFWWMGVI